MNKVIKEWLDTAYPGAQFVSAEPMGGGISASMTKFTVDLDGEVANWILRLPNDWRLANTPRPIDVEVRLITHMTAQGVPTSTVVASDETAASFGRPGLVLEYVQGKANLHPSHLATYLSEWANTMAAIHKAPLLDGLPTIAHTNNNRNYRAPATNDYKQIGRIQHLLQTHSTSDRSNPDTIIHGDLWPGNFVWEHPKVAAVIDWEEAGIGDPLFDVSIARLEAFWIFGPAEADHFTETYLAANPIDITALPLWDLRIALRATELDSSPFWEGSFVELGRPDLTTEVLLSRRLAFIDQAENNLLA